MIGKDTRVSGYMFESALEAGLRTAPIAVGMVLGASTAPRLVERFGTARVVTFGLVILAAATGLIVRVKGDGRTYQLRLRTSDRFDGVAYRALFATDAGE